jgi:peptide/nickel transport system substrate-binding protein
VRTRQPGAIASDATRCGSPSRDQPATDRRRGPQHTPAAGPVDRSNATRIKLNLRKGVQFHSGREFTSDDVRWNLMRARDPKTAVQQFQTQSAWFTGIDTPDKYTIVLSSDQPRPSVFDFFELFNIADRDAMDASDAAARVIGTGPFMLAEYAQGDHITFKRNPNYWRPGAPYLDGFTVQFLTDAQAMTAQLEGGPVDMVVSPALRDAVRLQSNPTS